MIIFFYFLNFVYSEFIELKENELINYINNSLIKPIFIFFYVNKCPNCEIAKNKFNSFVEENNKRIDILITKINCRNFNFCNELNLQILPQFYLIHGNNSKYWPNTSIIDEEFWKKIINSRISSLLIKKNKNLIQSNWEFSLNHINSPTENDINLRFIRKYIKNYFYFTQFTYEVNSNFKQTELIINFTPNCQEKIIINSNNSLNILKNYIFGPLYEYNLNEYLEINKFFSTVFYITNTKLIEIQKKALLELSKKNCQFKIGWIIFNKDIENLLKINKTELPHLIIFNRETNNFTKYFGKICDINI